MDQFDIKPGHYVVVIWDDLTTAESNSKLVQDIRAVTGSSGNVAMENIERLQLSAHKDSSFDVVLSGVVPESTTLHSFDVFAEVARILKPGGRFYFKEPGCISGDNGRLKTASQLGSLLKLAGFTEICEMGKELLTADQLSSIDHGIGSPSGNLVKHGIKAKKPDFEVGSSSQLKLSFVKKNNQAPEKPQLDPNAAKAWTLSATDMNDDDVDFIDSDELLDENDLKKPDPASLRIMNCGDSKKKKRACKNCTCGLAEELVVKGPKDVKSVQVKSSCGSCYLGDAFRCASCPYMGMPAFKPGEQILLTNKTLSDA
ncbi:anamorsin [Leucoraja erinacea]|uniref:anamorsin n=1 Tax=Leucoraja erinaceus TaxID=7782 RepID=UPI0024546AF7|nr:anamorsin [Leucoraja erinacea]XP_055504737.1 anamorsin [Leucoraja erinacea]